MRRLRFNAAWLLLVLCLVPAGASAETLSLLPSSPELTADGLPKHWEPLIFKKIKRHGKMWKKGHRQRFTSVKVLKIVA